jgi:hypothetical protein
LLGGNDAAPCKGYGNGNETNLHISIGKYGTLSCKTHIEHVRLGMARTNYSFEKRQRELAKKKKKEEKREQKAAVRRSKTDGATPPVAVDENPVE